MTVLQKVTILLLLCVGASVNAQQTAMPGRILFRISADGITPFREAFAGAISTDKHFDPQTVRVSDAKKISSLLGLPASLKVNGLKPFVAEHNVVLEKLRESGNPILFLHLKNGSRMRETEELAALRKSEESLSRWFELVVDASVPSQSVIALLKKSPLVEVAEPRYKFGLCFTPNDSLFNQQYSLPLIHAPEAWDIQRCDSTMLVAVDDIGTDWNHIDLRNAIYINQGEVGIDADGLDKRANGIDDDGDGFVDDWHGWDFAGGDGTAPDNDPTATAQHGTHTGGIMAASGNNRSGVCGVAFGAKLLVLKCGDNQGRDVAYGYEGMVYAADRGAKVVNNSWGGNARSDVGQEIINYVNAKNCVVVAASGNDGQFEDFYPASYDHVLSVASVDADSRLSSFSNFGTHVDVCAPGSNVLNTVPGSNYASLSGTSMASPTAAGAIALVRQRFPNLSADQAVEQLRVSCGTVTDNAFPQFTGGGIVNIEQAIGGASKHSVRIVNVEVDDDNNDHFLVSNEGADLILSVRNFLDPITNLKAQIEISSGAEYISNFIPQIQFGNANTLDIIQNVIGTLHIKVAPNVPANQVVVFRVKFTSDASHYGPDIDYFSLIINRAYLDLNKNNITTTIDSKGGFGYNNSPNNSQGSGFLWSVAPPSISPQGKSVLSQGGLMIGVDTNHVVASAPGAYSDSYADQDFTSVSAARYIAIPDHQNALQEIETSYDDSKADSAVQIGVTVRSRSYSYAEGASSDAVLFDYLISKRTAENGIAPSDSTAVALFMDWDIGASGAANVTSVSAVDPSIFMMKRIDPDYPVVGIKLISKIPLGASQNFYALENDGSNGSYNTYYGYSKYAKWATMTTPRAQAGPSDVSMIFGLKNVALATLDSIQVTYIIALGVDESSVKAAIDKTESLWNGVSAVHPETGSAIGLQCYPNPFADVVNLQWNTAEGQTSVITITDVLGREVVRKQVQQTSTSLELGFLPSGAYRVLIESDGKRFEQEIIAR